MVRCKKFTNRIVEGVSNDIYKKKYDVARKRPLPDVDIQSRGKIGGTDLMTALAILCILVGLVFGVNLKYFSLFPAIVATLAAIMAVAITRSSGFEWAVLAMVLAATALEAGYLCGAVLRRPSDLAPKTSEAKAKSISLSK
jgi:hypothetical protein